MQSETVPNQPASLYLLAGTTTDHGLDSYPVTIYRIDPNKRTLWKVRTVAPASQGAMAILDDTSNIIFVISPHTSPNVVDIVRKNSPEVVDEVRINEDQGNVIGILAAASREENDNKSYVLLPTVSGPNITDHPTITSVSAAIPEKGSRVETDQWRRYHDVRVEGQSGGGELSSQLLGVSNGHKIDLSIGPKGIELCESLPDHAEHWEGRRVSIISVNDRFIVIGLTRSREQLQTGDLQSAVYYVYDRKSNKWTSLPMSSDSPRARVFGSWLATIAEYYRPANDDNPGRENERSFSTKELPNVKDEFNSIAGASYRIPGILDLYNLVDGRRLTIHTNQEDSEILGVFGDSIIYRVNDSIYQTTISGGNLVNQHLLVTDQDVPEIHWSFMSSAK